MPDAGTSTDFISQVRQARPSTFVALRFIASILLEQRALLFVSLCLLLVSSLAMVIGPRLIGLIVDQMTLSSGRQGFYLLVFCYASSEIFRLISTCAHSFSIARLGQSSLHALRQRVFIQIECLPLKLHDRARTGELMTFITNDIQTLSEMFSAGFMVVVEKFLVVVFTVISLFLLSPQLALIGLGAFFVLLGIGVLFSRKLKGIYRELREANSLFNSCLSENVEGIAITRLNGFEEHRLKQFSEVTERLRRAQLAPIRVFAAFHPLVTMVNAFSIAALGIFGGGMVMRGEITLGTLVSALGYVLWLFWPIIIIVDRWNTFLNGLSATERLIGLLALDREKLGEGAACVKESVKGEIKFEHVWFAYQGEEWVIRDFSMTIVAGTRVAFFGATGSGKTTLTSLLLRLYEPQRGRILIDGIDIRSIALSDLRGLFGVVQQDAVIYEGTILENISLFEEKADPNHIQRVSSSMDLGRSLQNTLSMGERQIVAFERARFQSPVMWILDEATAHLDPALDRQLEQSLLGESLGKTVIIIAHRLSSLALVDTIFVLSKGTLLESGSHQELFEKDAFYARYVSLQEQLDRCGCMD